MILEQKSSLGIDKNYIPLSVAASINEVSEETLRSLKKNGCFGNEERFKTIDGKLYILENYRYPYAQEVGDLISRALIVSKTEDNLCKQLSKISKIRRRKAILLFFKKLTFTKTINKKILCANKAIEKILINFPQTKHYVFQKYFYRFTFKNIKTAKNILTLIQEYISSTSLFPVEELIYD